ERRAEEGGTYWALRKRREPEERERRRGVAPPSLAPPAIGGAERQGEQQDEERVRPCDPGLPEEGVTGGEDDPSQEPRRRPPEPACRPGPPTKCARPPQARG